MRLNIGSGALPLKAVNLDLKMYYRVDKRTDVIGDMRSLPFKDSCAEEIVCFHAIEHLEEQDGINMLHDFKRILLHGGKVIIEAPDVEKAGNNISRDSNMYKDIFTGNRREIAAGNIEHIHRSMWTGPKLKKRMESIGFRDVEVSDGLSHANVLRDFRVTGFK